MGHAGRMKLARFMAATASADSDSIVIDNASRRKTPIWLRALALLEAVLNNAIAKL